MARAGLVLALMALPAIAAAQPRTADPAARGFKDSDFPRLVKIADDVYGWEDFHPSPDRMTTVSMFVVTPEGVLLADGQATPAKTQRLLDGIRTVTNKPLKYYIVCSDHGDHTGGNSVLPPGVTVLAHPASRAALERMKAALMPTEVMTGDSKTMTLGGTEFRVLFLGRAHTGGDLSVYLPKQKVLFMSEAYLNRVFPAMRSAYPSEWVEVLKKAEKMDVEIYVPGHGFVEEARASREELVEYRKAVEAVIAEVKRLHAAKVPVEDAITQADFGPYTQWKLHESQRPIAVRKIYDELDGKLPKAATHPR